jgi:hypothetical protein
VVSTQSTTRYAGSIFFFFFFFLTGEGMPSQALELIYVLQS